MMMQMLVAILLFVSAAPAGEAGDEGQKRQIFPIEIMWAERPIPMKPWQIELGGYQYYRGLPPKRIMTPAMLKVITLDQIQVIPLQTEKP